MGSTFSLDFGPPKCPHKEGIHDYSCNRRDGEYDYTYDFNAEISTVNFTVISILIIVLVQLVLQKKRKLQ